jgi:hypothetical protein
MSKPFDERLYEADDNAKHLVIDYLRGRGNLCDVNPDQYGIDLVCENPAGEEFVVEVEVKHNWVGDFAFPDVHWPVRKLKFAQQSGSWFFMLNHDRTQAIVCAGSVLARSEVVTKSTKYTDSEQFLAVPTRFCSIITF